MVGLIVNWLLSAAGLLIVAFLAPGFRILDFQSTLIVVMFVGLIAAIFGMLLRAVNGAVALVLCALLLVVADAVVFRVAALLVPGFAMLGFLPAFIGAVVLVAVQTLVRFRPRHTPLSSEHGWLSS